MANREEIDAAEDAKYAELEALHATDCFGCGMPLSQPRKIGDSPFCSYECAAHPVRSGLDGK